MTDHLAQPACILRFRRRYSLTPEFCPARARIPLIDQTAEIEFVSISENLNTRVLETSREDNACVSGSLDPLSTITISIGDSLSFREGS